MIKLSPYTFFGSLVHRLLDAADNISFLIEDKILFKIGRYRHLKVLRRRFADQPGFDAEAYLADAERRLCPELGGSANRLLSDHLMMQGMYCDWYPLFGRRITAAWKRFCWQSQ
jgi:hypothetical protein